MAEESESTWGIIRYLRTPINSGVAFDGWYTDHSVAKTTYRMWCNRYPNSVIALVKQDAVRFPDP